jgi:hypothetical protein
MHARAPAAKAARGTPWLTLNAGLFHVKQFQIDVQH